MSSASIQAESERTSSGEPPRAGYQLQLEVPVAITRSISRLSNLPRLVRQALTFGSDLVLCFAATWIAFYLRYSHGEDWQEHALAFAGAAAVFWAVIGSLTGVYVSVARLYGTRAIARLGAACSLLALALALNFTLIQIPGIPRTIAVIQPLVFFVLLRLNRVAIRLVLVDLLASARSQAPSRRVLIYGAGSAGHQLALSVRYERGIRAVGIIDDNAQLAGRLMDGLPVWHSARLTEVIARYEVDEVLLAIPSATHARRRSIVDQLQCSAVSVRSLPGIGQIMDGRVTFSDLRDVQIEDLLGREPAAPNDILMARTLVGKRVMVTGAGGSIGSELCRQILAHHPKELILVERSEYSLYAIDQELREFIAQEGIKVELITELADIADEGTTRRIFTLWKPDSVFHAAAYKHVPLVEGNPLSGIGNNVLGTLHCCLAAEAVGVKSFILISTDKAVRPTNVMGASKRLCELVLQARAEAQSRTTFSMVRFGNVLGSSGSVVPLFRAQIAKGGPVTVTHRDVTRYFMTIPEAAQLVIQAGGMAKGGEVFVLDMGESVRILDLAHTMIRLSGLTVRDADHPHGDIEIVESGLRPGEKLYEELLIGDNPMPTIHDRIVQAREKMIAWSALSDELDAMAEALNDGGTEFVLSVLKRLVPEYKNETQRGVAIARM